MDTTTWAGLLARYTEAARASAALPTEGAGGRWRSSVTPAITLHAITMALRDLAAIADAGERALAIDRAGVLIGSAAGELAGVWRGSPMPEELLSLLEEARAAHAAALRGGLQWHAAAGCGDEGVVLDHPGPLAEGLVRAGFAGELYVAQPGVAIGPGAPVAFCRGPGAAAAADAVDAFLRGGGLDVTGPTPSTGLVQVYRQFDFAAGGPVRDVLAPEDADPMAGQPLLVAAVLDGVVQPVSLGPRRGAPAPPPPLVGLEADGPDGASS